MKVRRLTRVEGYGLEKTGVKVNEKGAIDINGRMQTNVPHIYAIGDVTAKLMLAHVAEAMGIIPAGATTRLLPGSKLSERVVTYEEQIMEDKLPKSIVIVGAGAIGVDFAYVMHNYGVDVTIVEFLDRVVPLEDEEISAEPAKHYRRAGIKALVSTRVDKIEEAGGTVKVHVTDTKRNKSQVLEAEKVMQAIGFKPRVDGVDRGRRCLLPGRV